MGRADARPLFSRTVERQKASGLDVGVKKRGNEVEKRSHGRSKIGAGTASSPRFGSGTALYGDEPFSLLIAHFLVRILRCTLTNPRTICKSKVVPEIRHMPIAQDAKESPEMAAGDADCFGRETDRERRGICRTRDRVGLEHRDQEASEGDSRAPGGFADFHELRGPGLGCASNFRRSSQA